MEKTLDELEQSYQEFMTAEPARVDVELGKTLLLGIRLAGRSAADRHIRLELSSMARDIGDRLLNLTGEYYPVRLHPLAREAAPAQLTTAEASAASMLRPSRLPLARPPRAAHFTGREEELRRLLSALRPGRVVTLCGPGGIGKTALAAEVVWTLAPDDDPLDRFPDGVLFHSFYHQPEVAEALEYIATAYGEDPRPDPETAARRALAGRHALLVLDGAENADDLDPILDIAVTCAVLITSRSHEDAPADWRDIAALPIDEAVALLQAWAGPRVTGQAVAERICELVGGLPLAVPPRGQKHIASPHPKEILHQGDARL